MAFDDGKLGRRRAAERRLRAHRDLLIEGVRRHILPVFIRQGFVVSEVSSDSAGVFPLGHLRRNRKDETVDLVEVQFMSLRRAAFRINACTVPKEGIRTLGGQRTGDEVDVAGGLHDHFEMYASPRWRRWFSLPFWRFRTPTETDYDDLARRVATMLPEVELALLQGKLGPHVRKITFW
jgi:hypothetical protein